MVMEDFQVFIKPVGGCCNLRCSYCYYRGDTYGTEVKHLMSVETLENCIKQHFSASSGDTVFFTWHGGEPLLAGIDFYKKALAIQKKYLPQGKNFLNGIQTNGTLITKDWCKFLSENGFAVGISIDGPDIFHDAMRRSSNQIGSFEKTLAGYGLLREYGINAEILCVVNAYNVRHPIVVYDFFKMLGSGYITFLPLVEKNDNDIVTEKSVPAFEFGLFLSAIFDEWIKKDIGTVKIQIFEEALRTAFNQEHTLCIFKERCGGVPVIEHNGDFFSCDHFVDKNHRLGNINEQDLEYLLNHNVQNAFGNEKLNSLPQYCLQCDVRKMCNGECPKYRFIISPDGEPGLNYLCEGYQYFFKHCKPFVNMVAEVWGMKNEE